VEKCAISVAAIFFFANSNNSVVIDYLSSSHILKLEGKFDLLALSKGLVDTTAFPHLQKLNVWCPKVNCIAD
jgi:hypothetical protein